MPSASAARAIMNPPAEVERGAGKCLSFRLGPEEFVIRVTKVREILGIRDITAIPRMPAYVKGVINLRGKVIPVVDLRLRLGLPSSEYTARTCIIVVQVQREGTARRTGVIVDEVSEVLNLAASQIENPPELGDGAAAPYVLGTVEVKGKKRNLLDIDRVLISQE